MTDIYAVCGRCHKTKIIKIMRIERQSTRDSVVTLRCAECNLKDLNEAVSKNAKLKKK